MSALLVGESAQTAVTSAQLRSLVLVLAASAAAAFLARIGPHLVLPTVVVEILLGIVIGPEVLGWASEGMYIEFLANFGLALLSAASSRAGTSISAIPCSRVAAASARYTAVPMPRRRCSASTVTTVRTRSAR